MPPEVLKLYEKLWHQALPAQPVTCHMLKEATVEGPGLVFDEALRLVSDTVHQSTEAEIDHAELLVHEAGGKGLQTIPGVTLLVEKAGIGNYGHWLVEMLPIAWLNRRFLNSNWWRVRLPSMGGAMEAIAKDSLALIGVPDSQMLPRPSGPARYEQLVLMRGLTYHGIRYSPLVIECLEALAADIEPAPPAKLWFSRRGAKRSLDHEPAICAALARNGWLILEPGLLTLREQIAYSKGAIEIAGTVGAGLTNLAFAPRHIRVTAFMPAAMPDVFFWMLAGFKQQDFREVRCSHPPGPPGSAAWEARLQLSVDEALSTLLA